ncbi:hypothetical protein A4H97_15285 [Niastella yeongjuensis]|uniref:Outer membrane protein beta-barrel domain-containing protein n=1 Tax=Niastella yeongjuensis TaxID=354355 RepID=A0A1V9E4X1_9BACT|nr:hypothetical protein [Niastella yeongjuensis]OQP40965.1 hypothetical protein A4H97_15285 [Niastella yeongjuensis]SEO96417.1 hypothetical protein SAMN05660816_03993 [Niastella yeongjuensis]
MLKYLLFLLLWPFESLQAQNLQVSANAGYFTGASLKATRGRFIFGDGPCYTGAIALSMQPDKLRDVCFELQYGYVSTSMRFQRYDSEIKMPLGSVKMHTILAGAGKEFGKRTVHVFGKAFLGAAYFDPDSIPHGNRITFSFSFAGGMRISITHAMGICLQAQVLLPLMYNRVYVGWEPDNGLQTMVTPLGILYSGYLTGGIYYKIIQKY